MKIPPYNRKRQKLGIKCFYLKQQKTAVLLWRGFHLSDQHQMNEEGGHADDEDKDLTSSRLTKQLRKQVTYWCDKTLNHHKLEMK